MSVAKTKAAKQVVAPVAAEPVAKPTKKTKPVAAPVVAEPVATPVSRTTAIHAMWDELMAGPVTVEQLAQKVAAKLIAENQMAAEDASKLATTAINHQLPYEDGRKGRKGIRVRQIKGGKLEWIGGTIRRRQTA